MAINLSNFFKTKPSVGLGIDIGSSIIKMVELSNQGGGLVLSNYGLAEMQFADQGQRNVKEIGGILHELVEKSGIQARTAFVGISENSTFSTTIDLPKIPESEIGNALRYEARKYIPVAIDEVVLDWLILPPLAKKTDETDNSGSPESIRILLVAVLKDVINHYTEIMNMAGLGVSGFEAETFSLIRALAGSEKEPAILLDIGTKSANFSIIASGFLRFNYEFDVPALIHKDTPALVKQANERIASETLRLLNMFQTQVAGREPIAIKKCILTGGGLYSSDLMTIMKNKLVNIEIAIGVPFNSVSMPQVLNPVLTEAGPALSVATGLALRYFES